MTLSRASGIISPIFSIFCLFVSRTRRIPRPFFSFGSSSAFWDACPIVGDASIGPIGWGGAGTKGRLRVRMSFRIRILIPWSAMVQESCVDSEGGVKKKNLVARTPRTYPPCRGTSWPCRRRRERSKLPCSIELTFWKLSKQATRDSR